MTSWKKIVVEIQTIFNSKQNNKNNIGLITITLYFYYNIMFH